MLPRSRLDEMVGRGTFDKKRNGFSTNCLSAQKALQMAPGVSQMLPEAPAECSRWVKWFSKGLLEGSFFKIPPLGFSLWDSFLKIAPSGFLQDSSSWIPPLDFLLQLARAHARRLARLRADSRSATPSR